MTDRNQILSDKLFSQQTDVELQRHLRTNSELKQQHEVLLSTLLLEQQLHSTAANEHKQLVKEVRTIESFSDPNKLCSLRKRSILFSYKMYWANIKFCLAHTNTKHHEHRR